MKKLRIYLDTSVFGGCFEPEFAAASKQLLDEVRAGRYSGLVSAVTFSELHAAPERVRALLDSLPRGAVEQVLIDEEVDDLCEAYLAAGVVGARHRDDAAHVAAATVGGADAIVSWNFKHIVHLEKMRGYNSVNLGRGYRTLEILSPKEVVHENEEEV